ncbi:MAG: hypothetical protein ABIR91_06045 [Candidatus Saccharimonadales bacterium]
MFKQLLTWKVYTWFLIGVIIIMSAALAYMTFFTAAFSGVDGWIGGVTGLIYIFYVVIFLIATQLLYLWLRRHPKVLRTYLVIFWVGLILTTALTVLFLNISARQQNDFEKYYSDSAQKPTNGVQIYTPYTITNTR